MHPIYPAPTHDSALAPRSSRDFVPTVLLCLFLGQFGVHRFYAGKIWTGLLQMVTLGGFGLWALYDLIMIILSKFEDKEGRVIRAG